MDPNAALTEIRGLVALVLGGDDGSSTVDRLAELIDGLDGWLSKGGFKPEAWTAGEDFELTDTGVLGIIQLADGTQSRFAIHGDSSWIQWGAPNERLGRTIGLVEALHGAFWEQEG